MMGQGALELFGAVMLALSLPTVARAARADGVQDLDFLVRRALALGLLLLAAGVLKVVTALRTLEGRGERLRVPALLSSVAGILTGCLAPTGLLLLALGFYDLREARREGSAARR
jgi:hypothetical protein